MNTTAEKAYLSVADLTARIEGRIIVDGISFEVARGETVGIIGPNGSGKTTMFNALSGFLVHTGRITLAGTDLIHSSPYQRAQAGLGRVFQNPGIFREMTVIENMLVAIESKVSPLGVFAPSPSGSKSARQEANTLLERVGLGGRGKERASSLSGGQLRLLEIARLIALKSEILLLDEPTAGVSPKMRESVVGLLADLSREGKTILVIEHDLNFIQAFCKRLMVLDSGKIVLDGPPEVVRTSPLLHEIYFGGKKVA